MNLNIFTRNASFLLKCTDLRELTRAHPSCFRLGKVRTLVPSRSSITRSWTVKRQKHLPGGNKSKACMSLAFWNEHTRESDTTWLHSPGELSGFVLYECSFKTFQNIFLFCNNFLPLGLQNTLWVFKIQFLVSLPPPLISKLFCFSGTSVSYHLECSEASPKYFQLSSHQDSDSTLRKEGEKEEKKTTNNKNVQWKPWNPTPERKKKIKKPRNFQKKIFSY